MPGGDGTGPRGMGPMTGRRMGYCGGASAPGYGAGRGRGMGWGAGRGGGWRRGWRFGRSWPAFGATEMPREDEAAMLREQAEGLRHELKEIERRITTLDSAAGEQQQEK